MNSFTAAYLSIIAQETEKAILETIKSKFIRDFDDSSLDAEKVWNDNLKNNKISIFQTAIKTVMTLPKDEVLKDPQEAYELMQEVSHMPGSHEYVAATHHAPEKYGGFSKKQLKDHRGIYIIKRHFNKTDKEDTQTIWFSDGFKCVIQKDGTAKYTVDKSFRRNQQIDEELTEDKNIFKIYIHNSQFEELSKQKQKQIEELGENTIDLIDGTRKQIKISEVKSQSAGLRAKVCKELGLIFKKRKESIFYYQNSKHITPEYFAQNFVKLCRNQIKQSEDIGQIPAVEVVKSQHFKQQYDIRLDYCVTAMCQLLDAKFAGQTDYKH